MRPAKPWYRSDRDSWYVQHGGKQVLLAKGKTNKAAATAAFHRLMVGGTAGSAERGGRAVAVLCDLFLDFSELHHSPSSFKTYRHYLSHIRWSGPDSLEKVQTGEELRNIAAQRDGIALDQVPLPPPTLARLPDGDLDDQSPRSLALNTQSTHPSAGKLGSCGRGEELRGAGDPGDVLSGPYRDWCAISWRFAESGDATTTKT